MSFDPLSAAFDLGGKMLDKFFPDPEKRAAAQLELAKMQESGELAKLAAETGLAQGQLAINQEEAKSPNWFVAGWRPFVGWTCGFALLYAAILDPMARFVAMVILKYVGPFPVIDTTITMQVLFGLLGLGGMRMLEKIKGAEGNR